MDADRNRIPVASSIPVGQSQLPASRKALENLSKVCGV